MNLEDFWGDWEHSSDDNRPAQYIAYAILTYHCGKCGLQLKKEGPWPQFCARGDKNVRPE